MKKIASENDPTIPDDKHFIPIDMNNLNDVIDNMIAEGISYIVSGPLQIKLNFLLKFLSTNAHVRLHPNSYSG